MSESVNKRILPEVIGKPFIIGIMGFLPLAITVVILGWITVKLHDLVGPSSAFGKILRSIGLNFVTSEIIAYVIGLVGTFALIYLTGIIIQGGLWLRFRTAFERALHRIPLVNMIYDASRQLTGMFDSSAKEEMKAMTPVLCSFGEEGATVMIALMPTSEVIRLNGQDYHVVIIPTAPVPVGGALLCVPVDRVKPVDCSFDGVVSIYMTMGGSAPAYLGKGEAGTKSVAERSD